MSLEPRFIFDTSVIISALLFENSVPGRAFYSALERGEVLVSYATFTELSCVLTRQKFDRYVTKADRELFLARFLREATLVEINEEVRACRDPNDDKLLELAVAGRASCVITGDRICWI